MKLPLSAQILIGVLLGAVTGLALGDRAGQFGELGQILITLIKTIATPLIFFAILDAILTSEITWGKASKLLLIVAVNGTIAALIGIGISNYFQPGQFLDAQLMAPPPPEKLAQFNLGAQTLSLRSVASTVVPTSILKPFVDNAVLSVVVLALLFGFAIRAGREPGGDGGTRADPALERMISSLLRAIEKILAWIVRLAPLAVFGVIAKIVGEHGFAPFKGLGAYTLAGIGGMSLQILLVYGFWVFFIAKISPRIFWREVREPVLYSAGVNSSLATLPLTLRALDRLGVSKASSRLGACVGTNLNNDGILLYEAMAVLFVAQAYGIDLSVSQQVTALALCVVAAIGIAGVPDAGIISLSLVLAAVGLPIEILPILMAVDWIVARARSVTNVLADVSVSIGIDAISRRAKV